MRRRIFNILSALSLVLCVAVCVLSAAHQWYLGPNGWSWNQASTKGGTRVEYSLATRYALTVDRQTYLATRVAGPLVPPDQTERMEIAAWGAGLGATSYYRVWGFFDVARWPVTQMDGKRQMWMLGWYRRIRIPYAGLVVILALLPICWVATRLMGWNTPRPYDGRCGTCGYDLRASKDRCPECGTRIPVRLDPPRVRL